MEGDGDGDGIGVRMHRHPAMLCPATTQTKPNQCGQVGFIATGARNTSGRVSTCSAVFFCTLFVIWSLFHCCVVVRVCMHDDTPMHFSALEVGTPSVNPAALHVHDTCQFTPLRDNK